MKHHIFFLTILGIGSSLSAGCQVRDVINHTRTCRAVFGKKVAKPWYRKSQKPRITTLNATVGERLAFRVEESIKPAGKICKEYLIRVDEGDLGHGSIKLFKREACGQAEDSPGLILVSTLEDVPVDACLIDLHVYDVYTVKMNIFSLPAKLTKARAAPAA